VPRHHARPHDRAPRRAYLALAATVVVLAAAVIALHIATGGATPARTDAASRSAACPASTAGRSCSAAGTASPAGLNGGSTGPTPAPTASSSPRPSPRATRSAPPDPTPAARPSATATTSAVSAAADGVLALINQARAQDGLPAYTISTGLELSSSRHNQLMANGCGLSHQCQGEPSLGARETAAGVHWTAAGENIGEGGPVADTSAAITQMAVTLTQDMLNEKPPDDGHRLNILSSAFAHIGIAVQRSADGTVWMTQDFSN
jgi:uncharacterized protein YkwD